MYDDNDEVPDLLDGFIEEDPIVEDDPLADFIRFALRPEPWVERAKCRELGVELAEFFPHRGQSQKVAKAACARCPVRAQCLDYAERSHTEHGIWGGVIRKRGQGSQRRRNRVDSSSVQPDIEDSE